VSFAPGAAERVSEGDGPAVGIDPPGVDSQRFDHPRDCTANASFNSITSICSSSNRELQRLRNRECRTDPHDLGWYPGLCEPRSEPSA